MFPGIVTVTFKRWHVDELLYRSPTESTATAPDYVPRVCVRSRSGCLTCGHRCSFDKPTSRPYAVAGSEHAVDDQAFIDAVSLDEE